MNCDYISAWNERSKICLLVLCDCITCRSSFYSKGTYLPSEQQQIFDPCPPVFTQSQRSGLLFDFQFLWSCAASLQKGLGSSPSRSNHFSDYDTRDHKSLKWPLEEEKCLVPFAGLGGDYRRIVWQTANGVNSSVFLMVCVNACFSLGD